MSTTAQDDATLALLLALQAQAAALDTQVAALRHSLDAAFRLHLGDQAAGGDAAVPAAAPRPRRRWLGDTDPQPTQEKSR